MKVAFGKVVVRQSQGWDCCSVRVRLGLGHDKARSRSGRD